jgi:hypothetical protein
LKGLENPIVPGQGALRRWKTAVRKRGRRKKWSGWEENAENAAPLSQPPL